MLQAQTHVIRQEEKEVRSTFSSERQQEKQSDQIIFQKTSIIRYDTSLPKDSLTGNHPVVEVRNIVSVKGKSLQEKETEGKNLQTISQTVAQTEITSSSKSTATVREKEEKTGCGYWWAGGIILVIFAGIGIKTRWNRTKS